ncbi:hypothetical protein ACTQ36_01180 [Holdemanella porci]|uniref:hypothetical protein n=1 Tax=Holdemanella porci TaxID=2652276 RepID=UPI003F92D8AD
MAKIDIGKTLKKTLNEAGNATKKVAETVRDTAKEIDKDKVKEIFKKKETKPKETPLLPVDVKKIPLYSALKIIYYLMSVDGSVSQEEKDKFDVLGNDFVNDFASLKEILVEECKVSVVNTIDAVDYYDVVQEAVEDLLLTPIKSEDVCVSPKFVLWNLLAFAYSDENYAEAERRLIKYFVRKLNIDKAIFLELESSLVTLMDLEKELAWIKTTDKPYLTIEAIVKELENRKRVIFESIKDIITL